MKAVVINPAQNSLLIMWLKILFSGGEAALP